SILVRTFSLFTRYAGGSSFAGRDRVCVNAYEAQHVRRIYAMNIAQGLAHARKAFGTRQAVVCGDTHYTWNEFDHRTDALARGIASLDVQRGDRLAVLMLNCHRYLELYYACARMGTVIVPMNIRLARPEIVFILNDSESKALVVDKTFASYITGRDTVPSLENVIYVGDETPPGMINYEDVVSKGTHMQESVDQEMDEDDLSGLYYTGGTTRSEERR